MQALVRRDPVASGGDRRRGPLGRTLRQLVLGMAAPHALTPRRDSDLVPPVRWAWSKNAAALQPAPSRLAIGVTEGCHEIGSSLSRRPSPSRLFVDEPKPLGALRLDEGF